MEKEMETKKQTKIQELAYDVIEATRREVRKNKINPDSLEALSGLMKVILDYITYPNN